ncbi:MAG: phage head closure protein [Clostridia bacterium]|nr:phage head closure protein [Clostridia bacterium]
MEYSEIIYLITESIGADDIGNQITALTSSKKCYAKAQSVRTNEFYSAVEIGMTPSVEFVVKKLNYNGEKEIEWNNRRYNVIRVVEPKNKFDIVLVCSVKIGGNTQGTESV